MPYGTVQDSANNALARVPYSLSSKKLPLRVITGQLGKDNPYPMRNGSIASTRAGDAFAPVTVENEKAWNDPDYTPQLLTHEMAHGVQNNWPQKIQDALPPVNSSDPYNYGGSEGLKKIGMDPTKLSREASAAAEQTYQAQRQNGNVDPVLKKFDENFGSVPLSVMQPTNPNQQGINTTPRTPGLPAKQVAGMERLYAKKTIPVKPGSGVTLDMSTYQPIDEPSGSVKLDMSTYQPVDEGPERPGVPAAPLPAGLSGPRDTRNALQQEVDADAEPESAKTVAGQSALKTGLNALGSGFTRMLVKPAVHPVETLKGFANTAADLGDANLGNYQPNNFVANTLKSEGNKFSTEPLKQAIPDTIGEIGGMATGGKLGSEAADAAAPGLTRLGEAAQRGGEGLINRTIGAVKSDFKRGSNPGAGYFQARLGPSKSIGSIASKANDALDSTGKAIGSAIDSGVGAGKTITPLKAATAIGTPINKAYKVLSGPGGGSVGPLEDLAESFRPSLRQAVDQGGFTPRQLFDVKKNVGQNTSWGDPTQIGLKSVRQQITGGLSGALSDEIPELRPLNSRFQNLTKLAERAGYRSDTGISPLTRMGARGLEALGGAGIGMATHHPLLGLLPLAMDSVPVRTGLASGLFYGGEAIPGLSSAALGVAGPSAAIAGIPKVQPKRKDDEE